MADVARLALQIDVTGARRAQQALKGLQDGSIRATRVTDQLTASTVRMGAATSRTAGAFRIQKGAIQQVGFQVGDFATQVSAGQSAIVAFGQQASQLAGIMGPGGALLGAVIAIGSGIAGAFARSMMTGSEATEDLTEKTRELVEELGKATDRQREFINTGFQQEMLEQEKAVARAEQTIYDINRRMESFTRNMGEQERAFFESSRQNKEWQAELDSARLVIDNAESSVAAITKRQEEFWKEVEESGKKTEETTDKLEEMVQSLQAQAETVGMSARETAIYEANRLGANQADREAINNAFDQIEAEKQRQEQIKETQNQEQALQKLRSDLDPAGAEFTRYADQIDAIEQFNISAAEKDRLREEAFRQHQERMAKIAGDGTNETVKAQEQGLQVLTMAQQNALSAVGNMFGNFADIAREGGEDQFSTWKAMASAQAAVSTALAVANALTAAPPPFNFALAASVGAMGAIQLAKIQGQEYQGARAMGGQVQAGSSYLVGERGPEVVTMGGTGMVTPNHKLGGDNNANVTQVFQLSDNARREAKQQILESAPMIQQMAKQAVLQAINQGGAMSRAVGRRS